jgi:hypothetical protein
MRRVKKVLVATLGLGMFFTGVMGFAHTRPGRPLLRLLGRVIPMGNASCPFGYDKQASPEQRELARRRFALTHAGRTSVVRRPAMGFVLDQTRREDVLAWALANQVQCNAPRSMNDLECTQVPASAFPGGAVQKVGASSLWFNFGGNGALVSVSALRRDPAAAQISAAFHDVNAGLSQVAGAPSKVEGTGDASELSIGLLRQASEEFRFRNYYALTRATNMGDDFVLTEEYRSLSD